MTFVIARRSLAVPVRVRRSVPARAKVEGWGKWLGWLAEGTAKRLVRAAALGTPVAALATMLGAVPAALALTDNDGRWAIPGNATPLEVEKFIRVKAQLQVTRAAPVLRYVAAGLPAARLRRGGPVPGRSGDVVSHWISRSTYGEDCPVTNCMEKVVSTWSFEPMRERMNVIIPVQVKRTRKPLWQADKVEFVTPDDTDVGSDAGVSAGCLDPDSGGRQSF